MADDTVLPATQAVKKPWLSKTLWTNLIVAATAFYPPASGWIAAHVELFSLGWGALNMILRMVTKDSLTFWE